MVMKAIKAMMFLRQVTRYFIINFFVLSLLTLAVKPKVILDNFWIVTKAVKAMIVLE